MNDTMGTCYSKTGHEAATTDREKLPKDKRKRSYRNGHSSSLKYPRLVIEDRDSVQKDVSDTVYTEDSHYIHGTDVDNCMNKSQQTSLDQLVKDASKHFECDNLNTNTGTIRERDSIVESAEQESSVINTSDVSQHSHDKAEDEDTATHAILRDKLEHLDAQLRDGKVSASDSGIVMEATCRGCDRLEDNCDIKDRFSEDFETLVDSVDSETIDISVLSGQSKSPSQNTCTCSNNYSDCKGHVRHRGHSSNCDYHEGDKRQSVASLTESNKITESSTDLDKIKQAIRQSSAAGTPTENGSYLDDMDASFDMHSTIQQPEVTTMTMNGRDVVVIDTELFSQIIDELQHLKMRLSQLTEVIQDEAEMSRKSNEPVLSASVS